MPYVNQSGMYRKTKMLLKAYDLTPAKLAKVLGCTYPTAKKKTDNPAHLTTGDWKKISTKHHVPVEEIREVFLS